jgi:ketohexokinase
MDVRNSSTSINTSTSAFSTHIFNHTISYLSQSEPRKLIPSSVPHFPKEDTKLRAQKVTRRRGGNVANTLEVLSDIIAHAISDDTNPHQPTRDLHLIAALPSKDSPDSSFIRTSINRVNLAGPFRSSHPHAATSMIIQSTQDNTRTIVSHDGGLPGLTCVEFLERFRAAVDGSDEKKVFVHFEGRNPQFILECVKELRMGKRGGDCVVSVECEHPEREGLDDGARLADVVFYSKLWAEVCLFCFLLMRDGDELTGGRSCMGLLDRGTFSKGR